MYRLAVELVYRHLDLHPHDPTRPARHHLMVRLTTLPAELPSSYLAHGSRYISTRSAQAAQVSRRRSSRTDSRPVHDAQATSRALSHAGRQSERQFRRLHTKLCLCDLSRRCALRVDTRRRHSALYAPAFRANRQIAKATQGKRHSDQYSYDRREGVVEGIRLVFLASRLPICNVLQSTHTAVREQTPQWILNKGHCGPPTRRA